MKNIFYNKRTLWLLISAIITSCANAMYYNVPLVPEFYQTVLANQELSQQNAILSQQLMLQQEDSFRAQQVDCIKKFDSLVAQAKKMSKDADGKFSSVARELLRQAATGEAT